MNGLQNLNIDYDVGGFYIFDISLFCGGISEFTQL